MCAELPKAYTLGSIAGNVYRLMCAWWASKLHSQGTGEYAQQRRGMRAILAVKGRPATHGPCQPAAGYGTNNCA